MKICIVKLSALGDIIHTMVVLQFIKAKNPDITIDWLVEESFVDILKHNPHINKILPINLKRIKKNKLEIFNQIKQLNIYSKNNYDIVIDTQGLLKSAICSYILGNKTVNSFVAGFDKNSIREPLASWFYDKTSSIEYEKNVIIRNAKLLGDCFDIKITTSDIVHKKPFLFFKNICKEKSDVIFVIGASKQNKIYPKEQFVKIAKGLSDYGIEVIWGSTTEQEIASYIQNSCTNVKMSLKIGLDQLKSKISNSSLVIGGDTGPTHMAWGLNIPSITIFGNTPHTRNAYITPINKVIKSKSIVDPLKLDKNDFSIKDIDPQDIVTLALELLNKNAK
jgi:heptosyltransferase-1